MSDYSELWEVVDELDDMIMRHISEDTSFCYGMSASRKCLVEALTRLGIERPQPKKVCGECRYAARFINSDRTEGICRPYEGRKKPFWMTSAGPNWWVALDDPQATDCECFEPKE